ncbi:hypothetical protein JCM19039_2078 [Geomicrobium sp. JCM 19039]|nr:hypothetical protein JCM19039_2078 [Geomicrobium sp. JCM 19039]
MLHLFKRKKVRVSVGVPIYAKKEATEDDEKSEERGRSLIKEVSILAHIYTFLVSYRY